MAGTADSRIGTDLGSYHIERVLGRGGMGVVYLTTPASLGRKVALKVLAPDLVDEEAFRQRLVRESQMAAATDHPNILPISEAGEIDGVSFLAMRYIDGADLEGRLRLGPLEPRHTSAQSGSTSTIPTHSAPNCWACYEKLDRSSGGKWQCRKCGFLVTWCD